MGRLPQIEQDNPEGRLDILAIRLIDKLVSSKGDFALKGLHARYKPYVDQCLHQVLGPVHIPGLPLPAPVASSRPLRRTVGAGAGVKARAKVEPIKPVRRKRKLRTAKTEEKPAASSKKGDVIDVEWEEVVA